MEHLVAVIFPNLNAALVAPALQRSMTKLPQARVALYKCISGRARSKAAINLRLALLLQTLQADANEADTLGLHKGASVHSCDGLSFADKQSIAIFRSFFPADTFPQQTEFLKQHQSITKILYKVGINNYTRACTRISAQLADTTYALHLQLRQGAPFIRSEWLNIGPKNQPVEYGLAWFYGERITITLDGV